MSTAGLRAWEIMWFKLGKIKGAQLKINLHSPIVHRMLIKNGKRTMMIRYILTELCKVDKNTYVSSCHHFFGTLSCNNCQEASDHHGSLTIFDRHSRYYRSV